MLTEAELAQNAAYDTYFKNIMYGIGILPQTVISKYNLEEFLKEYFGLGITNEHIYGFTDYVFDRNGYMSDATD